MKTKVIFQLDKKNTHDDNKQYILKRVCRQCKYHQQKPAIISQLEELVCRKEYKFTRKQFICANYTNVI